MNQPSPQEEQGRGAIRLTFAYEGDTVRLVSRRRVDMLVPPSDALSGFEGQQGFAAEVRLADGRLAYRRVLARPVPGDVEVFSGDPDEGIMRVPVERPEGVFVVVVPDLDQADHFALTRTAPPAGAAAAAAEPVELVRVPLGVGDDDQ